MGNSSSTRSKSKSIYRGTGGASGIIGSGLSSSTSKLAARIAPTFSRQHTSVSYIPQKNPQTPTRTPPPPTSSNARRNDRVIPAPETINQQRRLAKGAAPQRRVNLYGTTNTATDRYEEEWEQAEADHPAACPPCDDVFDQRQRSPNCEAPAQNSTATNGFDKSRNWISTSGGSRDDNKNQTPPATTSAGDIIGQWPCEIIDTDHPVIFVENRVYVHPNCVNGTQQQQQHPFKCEHRDEPWSPGYAHSTPKQQRRGKNQKTVVFEKVNYAKYQRTRSQQGDGGDSEWSPTWTTTDCKGTNDDDGGPCNESCPRHFFSTNGSRGEIDRDEYGQKWCQDLLNWSREAAEYQRQRRAEFGYNSEVEERDGGGGGGESGAVPVDSDNWFHDKFRSSSSVQQPQQGQYNRMSGTEDSGVVCQFQEDEDDDEFWSNNFSANDNEDAQKKGRRMGEGRVAEVPEVDSWEVLKQKVFERPAELNITPTKMVRDSDGRILGRRCSCNSMCTSLCTLETWVDDEVFDNNFNEELERRVEADGYGICRN